MVKEQNKIIPKLPASSGAFVVYKEKILLIKRDNKPEIPNPNQWSIAGGKVEEGESFDEALKRECKEEINVEPKNYQFLGFLTKIKDGLKRAIYIVRLDEDEVKNVKLGDEGQEIGWFTPHEIQEIDAVPAVKSFFQKNAKIVELFLRGRIDIKKLKDNLKEEIAQKIK